MHHRQDRRLVLEDRRLELLKGEPFSPGLFDGSDVGAIATGHIHKP